MTDHEIREQVKQIVANVTGMDPAEIPDGASFREDLDLDSLSLLEIGVDVAYEFKLEIPEEELSALATIGEAVELVRRRLAEAPQAVAC